MTINIPLRDYFKNYIKMNSGLEEESKIGPTHNCNKKYDL